MAWRELVKALMAVAMITFILQTILAIAILIYGVHLVWPDILNGANDLSRTSLYLVLPMLVPIVTLSGYSMLAYYMFLVVAILASCSWVFFTSAPTFAKELVGKAKSREHSPIFDICGLTFALLSINFVIILLADVTTTGGTTRSVSWFLFHLASASVWEEIAVRVLLIGAPLIFVDLVRRKMQTRWYAYFLGGKFEFGIPETILVIVSSAMFGYAHFLGGWGAWKIPATGIAGIAFGYLFLKYGLAAAITYHFAWDYLGMPSSVFDSFAFGFLTVLAILAWVGLGLVFIIYYVTRIGEFLTGDKFFEAKPVVAGVPWVDPRINIYAQMPVYRPAYTSPTQYMPRPPQTPPSQAPSQGAGGGYVCPFCGNTEARWVDGRFQCLRCGRLA